MLPRAVHRPAAPGTDQHTVPILGGRRDAQKDARGQHRMGDAGVVALDREFGRADAVHLEGQKGTI
jgi:hypothetical protein